MEYDLELHKILEFIKKNNAKTVCLQFPEGLKPKAAEVVNFLEKEVDAEFFIWLGSCFGSCDIPKLDVDALIHFGHTRWGKLL